MPTRSPALRTRLLGTLLLPLLAAGCYQQARFTQTTTTTARHTQASAIGVTTRNGSVSVQGDPGADEVGISATLRMVTAERLGQVSILANRDAEGRLEITADPPPGGWRSGEGCSFDITVPDAQGVTLQSSNGVLQVSGLSGEAVLTTSNGSITVLDHRGGVVARTANGRIKVEGASGRVSATTSNGAVTVQLTDEAAGPVDIDTSNGSVTLDLSDAFRGQLSIDTSNGAIRVPESGPRGVTYQASVSRRRATLTVGEGGPKSTIDTSNGSVTVRF